MHTQRANIRGSKLSAKSANGKYIGFSAKNMDLNEDPFKDFYKYSCGTWIKRHKLPKDKARIGSFSELEDKNTMILRRIIESCISNPSRCGRHGKLIADFYESFMDTRTLDKLGFKPIEEIIEKINSMREIRELPKLIAYLFRSNVYPFFVLYSVEDDKNSSIYSLNIDQGGIALPNKDYYLKSAFSSIRKKYTEHVKKVFALYGLTESSAAASSSLVLAIETELAKASRSRAELRDAVKNYNKLSMSELRERYKSIGICEIASELGANASYAIVGQPEFLDFVEKFVSEKELSSIKTYLKWQVLNSAASKLHRGMREEHFNFFGKALEGMKKEEPRWKMAIDTISDYIGEALGELYVKENFDNEKMKKAASLVHDIKASFRERIKTLNWMSSITKARALKKFDSMQTKLGYPARFRDYTAIKSNSKDLFGNTIRAARFELEREMKRVGKKVDKGEWEMNVFEANAYYDPSKNEIVLPAGIFNAPFFDTSKDDAVNYGAIGAIIGHELTHGYDDQGRLYDENGDLKDWWTSRDRKRFKMHASKIANLYSSFEVLPGVKENGILTLGESIADLGGFRIAYDALHLASRSNKQGRIDNFTQEQRFFIAFSQMWKASETKNEEKLSVSTDPHPIERLRGTIPPITHPEFEKLFREKSKLDKPKLRFPNIEIW
ncbi:MAG: M13 family metallopeptidase [Candidatus Micrarchaeia archaeon]